LVQGIVGLPQAGRVNPSKRKIKKKDMKNISSNTNKISKSEVLGLGPNSILLRQYKESLGKLSEVQWEAAIGLMLGDASIQTQNKGKTYRIKFEWGDKNKAYLDHVFELFDE
jgi:hypothetical protein